MSDVVDSTDNPIEIEDPFARRLVDKYLQRRRDDIGMLMIAAQSADFETVRVTGHNLYGSGAAYGLADISSIGAKLESAAKAADAPKIERLINDLRDFLSNLKVC